MDKIHVCYNYKLEHVLINDRYGEYNLKSMSEFIPSWRTAERFQWYLFWCACVRVWPSFLLLSHCDGVICGYTLLKRLLTGLPCLILKIFEVCFYSTVSEKLVIRYPWISEPRDQWRSQIFTDFTEKCLQSSKLSKTCLFIWMHILN